ncbi:MAG: glutathione S-transferase family protein [Gaiellaceae bacterium]
MRLYRLRFSTNVERVALALAHKGLEVESVWVDPADRTPVEEVSGQPLVPVIEGGGQVVVDSSAILRYLEERYPERRLYPRGESGRAEMDVYIDWFDRVCKRPPNELEAALLAGDPDPRLLEQQGSAMARNLDLHERLLAGRDYLLGDELSAADCAAFPFLKYALARDPEDDELFHRILDDYQSTAGRPRLEGWIRRVEKLPRA